MIVRHSLSHRSIFSLLGLALLMMAGCLRDPQALTDLHNARRALDQAEQEGKAEQFPGAFADLERRYLQAYGVFFACRDATASEMVEALMKDLDDLKPAGPPNRPPIARFTGPTQADAGTLTRWNASDSSDPDGDPLTYAWGWGDGTGGTFSFPIGTHRYTRSGRYTVTLTVDDGRGGTDSTTRSLEVRKTIILSDAGKVLFDFDRDEVKPVARHVLDGVIDELKADPELVVHITGHADWRGSDAYNMDLSKRRAQSVARYLKSRGIAAERISLDWKGESEPAVPNTSEANMALNRRAELVLQVKP